jgi:hypothetical protein
MLHLQWGPQAHNRPSCLQRYLKLNTHTMALTRTRETNQIGHSVPSTHHTIKSANISGSRNNNREKKGVAMPIIHASLFPRGGPVVADPAHSFRFWSQGSGRAGHARSFLLQGPVWQGVADRVKLIHAIVTILRVRGQTTRTAPLHNSPNEWAEQIVE